MALVTDTLYKKKLDKYHINIKSKYIVGHKILERNTDKHFNDDIKKGILCEKSYYVDNQLKHVENYFDSRIEYTFISKEEGEQDYTCLTCGYKAKLKDFVEGCPYCGTSYNIDYTEKELGNKYHYDRVLRSNVYKIVTAIVDFLVSFIGVFLFIRVTSRTFNSYDILKGIVYGGVLSILFYYFFYVMDAYFILGPIKRYKDKENLRQMEFWKRTQIDKKCFFNCFHYEIRKKFYSIENLVDYDVLDYICFRDFYEDNQLCVLVKVYCRLVYFDGRKFSVKYLDEDFVLKRYDKESVKLKNSANYVKCIHCGASIDVVKGYCDYCKGKISYLQEWILKD